MIAISGAFVVNQKVQELVGAGVESGRRELPFLPLSDNNEQEKTVS